MAWGVFTDRYGYTHPTYVAPGTTPSKIVTVVPGAQSATEAMKPYGGIGATPAETKAALAGKTLTPGEKQLLEKKADEELEKLLELEELELLELKIEATAVISSAVTAASTIVEVLNDVASKFYEWYLAIYSVPILYFFSPFVYSVSLLFNKLAWGFYYLSDWIIKVSVQVAKILSWDNILSLIKSWFPWLENAGRWFQNWWSNVWNTVGTWWGTIWPTVQGWISVAVQPFNAMLTAWSNFWNNTWPQLVNSFNTLKSSWESFRSQTLPGLMSFTWLGTWWNSRLVEVNNLISSAFSARKSLWEGWQDMRDNVVEFFSDPVEYIWQRFTDWFLGPEG